MFTTVTFRDTACAVKATPQCPATGKSLVAAATREGGPNAPVKAGSRVSAKRHGGTATKPRAPDGRAYSTASDSPPAAATPPDPTPWRRRLAQDGALLGNLTRIFAETVHVFCAERAAREGALDAKTGAVTVVQRTSSDLRLYPHLHLVALDGAWCEQGEEESADPDAPGDPESNLAAHAVSEETPPAGPQWMRSQEPLESHSLTYDKPLCASLDGFTLHAATRAGALDSAGREALLRYVLRPPITQERLLQRPDGLVRITLKKAYADKTVAVE